MSEQRQHISFKVYDLYFFIILFIAFLLPLYPPGVPIAIILLTVLAIIGFVSRQIPFNPKILLKSWPLWGLFSMLCISLLYTSDVANGISTLENKLSLIILPIVLLGLKTSKASFGKQLIEVFILGCVLSVLLNSCHALYQFIMERIQPSSDIPANGFNWFTGPFFSVFFHPSYLSMYLNLALFYLISHEKGSVNLIFNKIATRICMLLLTIGCVLLASKIGWIFMAILIFWWLYIVVRKKQWATAGIFIGSALVISTIIIIKVPEITVRIKNAVNFMENGPTQGEFESNAIRSLVWKEAIALVKTEPVLGVGIGDANARLKQRYIEAGMYTATERGLNSHSQFLQTQIQAGIIATFLLISSLIVTARRRNNGALFLSILLAVNLAVEAMLEKQEGAVFFCFFCVYYVYSKKNE